MDKNVDLSKNPVAAVAVVVGIIAVIGLFWSINSAGSSPAPVTQPETSQMQADEATPATEAEPKFKAVKFHGSGNDASNTVTLEKGVYRTKGSHQGETNFIIDLKGSDPSNVVGGFNELGNYSGVGTLSVSTPGKYIVDVMADGAWTFEIVDKL